MSIKSPDLHVLLPRTEQVARAQQTRDHHHQNGQAQSVLTAKEEARKQAQRVSQSSKSEKKPLPKEKEREPSREKKKKGESLGSRIDLRI